MPTTTYNNKQYCYCTQFCNKGLMHSRDGGRLSVKEVYDWMKPSANYELFLVSTPAMMLHQSPHL